MAAYQEMADAAMQTAQAAQVDADTRIADATALAAGETEAFRADYPTRLKFPLPAQQEGARMALSGSRACGTTDSLPTCAPTPRSRRRCMKSRTGNRLWSLYDLTEDGLYVARHLLGDGWLQIGKEKAQWKVEKRELGP